MNPSILEKLATEVAASVNPPDDTLAEGEKGIDISMVVTLIIGIVQAILGACPQPPARMRALFKKLERRQDAALWVETLGQCRCAGMSKMALPIFQNLKAKASQLSDADAKALITETSDDRNLLV